MQAVVVTIVKMLLTLLTKAAINADVNIMIDQLDDALCKLIQMGTEISVLHCGIEQRLEFLGRLVPQPKEIEGSRHGTGPRRGRRPGPDFFNIDKSATAQQDFELVLRFDNMPFGEQQDTVLVAHIPGQRRSQLDLCTR